MSNIFEKSLQLKEAIKPVVGKIVDDNTRPCFRTYKAMVVTPQDVTTGYGEVQLMGQGGNAESVKLRLPFTPAVAKSEAGDLVWVAVTYNSWKNAIVWQKIDFSTSGGGSGEFNPAGTYPNLTAGFANTANDPNAVHFIPQSLTNDQQVQARKNIGIEGTGKDGASVVEVEVLENGVVLPNIPISPEVLAEIKNELFPVNSIIARSDNVSPAQYLLGTWEKIAQGRTLIGASDTYNLGTIGGEPNHKLIEAEMPNHVHKTIDDSVGVDWSQVIDIYTFQINTSSSSRGRNVYTSATGGNEPHNNMQPYLVVNYWKRIA